MQKLNSLFLVISCGIISTSFGMELASKSVYAQDAATENLFHAVGRGDFNVAQLIVQENPQVVHAYRYHQLLNDAVTPLHLAAYNNDTQITQLLLQAKAACNAQGKKLGNAPLHRASKATAKLLIKNGASIQSKNGRGKSPLYSALFCYEGMRFDVAHYLLKCGAQCDETIDSRNNNKSLHEACKHNKQAIVQFLLEHKADVNACNAQGETALDIAIRLGHWHIVDYFRDHNLIFMPRNNYYNPFELLKNKAHHFKSLMKSSVKSKKIVAENTMALLFMQMKNANNGADLQRAYTITVNEKGYYFKHVSLNDLEQFVDMEAIEYVKEQLENRCKKALSLAKDGDYKSLKKLISNYPYVLSYDEKIAGRLFTCVIKQKDKNMLSYLLQYSSCVNGVDKYGNTPMHIAVSCGNRDAIQLLMPHNNSFDKNRAGKTVFNLAYDSRDQQITQALYNAFAEKFFSTHSYEACGDSVKKVLKNSKSYDGFNINFRDVYGRTLLTRAVRKHPDKCSLLLKNGALTDTYDDQKKSPLFYAVSDALVGGKIDMVSLLLHHKASVDKALLDLTRSIPCLYKLLYESQVASRECCICYNAINGIKNIPCVKGHSDMFMCQHCYLKICAVKRECPLCRGDLRVYGT